MTTCYEARFSHGTHKHLVRHVFVFRSVREVASCDSLPDALTFLCQFCRSLSFGVSPPDLLKHSSCRRYGNNGSPKVNFECLATRSVRGSYCTFRMPQFQRPSLGSRVSEVLALTKSHFALDGISSEQLSMYRVHSRPTSREILAISLGSAAPPHPSVHGWGHEAL
jgi:hypothetical protein